jgi:hypothetical protein
MDIKAYGDIVACLPQSRTLFSYGRDKFAPMLLGYLLNSGWDTSSIRQSQFKRLCERPPVKALLAAQGRMELTAKQMAFAQINDEKTWRLSVSRWGDPKGFKWNQTSRRGCSLVLQLNFSNEHDVHFRRLFPFATWPLFNNEGHPVSKTANTLAWARIDLDLDRNEALIEEIQSDWVRRVNSAVERPQSFLKRCARRPHEAQNLPTPEAFKATALKYRDDFLPKFFAEWQEVIMAACLFFIFEELGLSRVYMHEFETGNRIKRLAGDWCLPPRSIYTDLPRKFCFANVDHGPDFLGARIQQIQKASKPKAIKFWKLNLKDIPSFH